MSISETTIVRLRTGEELSLWHWNPFTFPDVEDQTPFKTATTRSWPVYKHPIGILVHVLRVNRWRHFANVCGALGLEFFYSLKDKYNRLFGKTNDYTEFGVNPAQLSNALAEKRDILLLHGKGGNQG